MNSSVNTSNQGRPSNRRAPWLALLVAAALPAIALAAVWQFAVARIPPPQPVPPPIDVSQPAADQLGTPLLSARREPTALAVQATAARQQAAFAASTAGLIEAIGPDSCLLITEPDPDSTNPHVLADYRSHDPVVPASNTKLLTAAGALAVLGPDYRYTTTLMASAPNDGVIDGPLYIVGGGDPLLASPDFRGYGGLQQFNTTPLSDLIDQLKALGVRRIDGPIVADGSRYDDERRAPTWGNGISLYDVAPIGGLVIDDGADPDGNVYPNPNQAAAQKMEFVLEQAGIRVTGSPNGDGLPQDRSGLDVVASVQSQPMSSILIELLQTSDNTTAEMVLKEIGLVAAGTPTRAGGTEAIVRLLDGWGIDTSGVSMEDGSGLSRSDRMTCTVLNQVLTNTPVSAALLDALPIAAQDGTLANHLHDTPADGTMRAKTGTLHDVKALSGRMQDAAGQPIFFSLVLNFGGADQRATYEPLWAELANVLARYPAPVNVDPATLAPR